MLVSRNSRN